MFRKFTSFAVLALSLTVVAHAQDPKSVLEKYLADGPGKIAFMGVFLDSRSRAALTYAFPMVHEKLHAEHVTLRLRPGGADLAGNVGRRVSVRVIGYAEDDRCQVVAVRLPSDILCDNAIPHITMSVAPGVPPKYSNDLLLRGFDPLDGPTLTGIIGVGR